MWSGDEYGGPDVGCGVEVRMWACGVWIGMEGECVVWSLDRHAG